MGVVPPKEGFLEGLRKITSENNILLIFDEVITGFRLAYGGAQEYYGIKPDLTCLGKIIGGGLPIGAYGGRRDIMERIAPLGPVYQAGTLSGNPLAMTAGIETLKALKQPNVYQRLEAVSARLQSGLEDAAAFARIPVSIARVGSLLTIFFQKNKPTDWDSAAKSDTALFGKFFRLLLEDGIYWPPSQYEAAFVSMAHSELDIEKTIEIIRKAFAALRS